MSENVRNFESWCLDTTDLLAYVIFLIATKTNTLIYQESRFSYYTTFYEVNANLLAKYSLQLNKKFANHKYTQVKVKFIRKRRPFFYIFNF